MAGICGSSWATISSGYLTRYRRFTASSSSGFHFDTKSCILVVSMNEPLPVCCRQSFSMLLWLITVAVVWYDRDSDNPPSAIAGGEYHFSPFVLRPHFNANKCQWPPQRLEYRKVGREVSQKARQDIGFKFLCVSSTYNDNRHPPRRCPPTNLRLLWSG